MNCPKCGERLPDGISTKLKFCPVCGDRLFEDGEKYIVQIFVTGNREEKSGGMLVFVDDREMYETKVMDSIYISLSAGFHSLKFRQKIRSKSITLLVNCDYSIKASYNTLSSLIETSVTKIEDKAGAGGVVEHVDFSKATIATPSMVSSDERAFDVMLGEDDPEFEMNATSGLVEGELKIFSERLEFSPKGQFKKEVINYVNVDKIRKKMGSIDVELGGNVHKIYSIPKDIYNEVLAYLTNKISEVKRKK
jgi:predicted  nucleic acid-binding Zn-ribbon protein